MPESERLVLREWREKDWPFFSAIHDKPPQIRLFSTSPTAHDTLPILLPSPAEHDERGHSLYAMALTHSCSLIGLLGFHWADFEADFTPCVEIGWRLVPEAWGYGYATEGARACLKHGFARFGFDRVYSFTACVNFPSQAVMQRVGMRKIAEFNHPKVAPDSILYPHVLYVKDTFRKIERE